MSGLHILPCWLRALDSGFCSQDLLHCIFLAEGSYKVVDLGNQGATDVTSGLYAAFPPQFMGLTNISWCLPDVNHRCASSLETAARGLAKLQS